MLFFLFLGVFLIGTAPAVFPQQRDFWSTTKFEFSTAINFQRPLMDSSYFHKYSPPFLSGPYESTAQQSIYLRGKDNWGLNVTFAYFPLKKLGLQFQFEYAKPRIRGSNTRYDVHLSYAIGDFSGPPPYPYIFERSFDWPNTDGYLTQPCFSLNPVARLPFSKRIALNISGGLTYFIFKGEGVSLTYSKFWIDEEGYFVGETYQMKWKFGTAKRFGLNVGAEFNWVLFNNVSFTSDLRYYACPKTSLHLDILRNEMLTDDFGQVKDTMNLGKIRVNASFYRVNLGLKYLF
jgi:opacity protein-like surface antigen